MSHNEKSLFWICVILAMGMALTALMISLPRTVDSENPISLDYQGAIVTVFSILVTILVGWQIYNAISIDKRIRRLENRVHTSFIRIERANKRMADTEIFIYGSHDLIFSLIQYNRGLDSKDEKRLGFFCEAYIMSLRAIAAYLSIERESDSVTALIDLGIQGLRNSVNDIFVDQMRERLNSAFPLESHNICEHHFQIIRENAGKLSLEHFNVIMDCHTLRRSFAPQS